MGVVEEFKTFILKGNVIDLAVAVVIGLAFNNLITAFVSDIITPLIGIAGHVDFSAISITINGSTFLIGSFLNIVISFIILALVIFFIVVKSISKLQERSNAKKQPAPPQTKTCPECLSQVPMKAKRCAFCTSALEV